VVLLDFVGASGGRTVHEERVLSFVESTICAEGVGSYGGQRFVRRAVICLESCGSCGGCRFVYIRRFLLRVVVLMEDTNLCRRQRLMRRVVMCLEGGDSYGEQRFVCGEQ
jgi:hypothetical protein